MFNPQMKTTLTWINFGLTNGGHNIVYFVFTFCVILHTFSMLKMQYKITKKI